MSYEYRLPWDISANVAYVGTRTDGGYADLNINYGTPGGGNATRQYFDIAGTTAINDWASRTKSRYHALQIELNRPLKDDLMLKGAYTYSRAKNMADEDGWVGQWRRMARHLNQLTAEPEELKRAEEALAEDMNEENLRRLEAILQRIQRESIESGTG